MAAIELWWQPHTRPYHCRPDDPWYSADAPEAKAEFVLKARPGAVAAVQLMLCSPSDTCVEAVTLDCPWPVQVPALVGVDRLGAPMTCTVPLRAGRPWAIWVLPRVPMLAQGPYSFPCTVRLIDGHEHVLPLTVEASGEPVYRGNEDAMHSMARLAWLNSDLGCEETVTAPYLPVGVKGNILSVLGREVVLDAGGLPAGLRTRFAGINDVLLDESEDIFMHPPVLEAVIGGAVVAMTGACSIIAHTATRAVWQADLTSGSLSCTVRGALEFDGWMHFDVAWSAEQDAALDDIRLLFFPKRKFARWLSGVGTMAVEWPVRHEWRWDRQKQQDAFYCGGMNGGIVCRPVKPDYVRPYCNIYYKFGPRNQPDAWVNGGEGHFALEDKGKFSELGYHTGALTLHAGQPVDTSFELGFTPFKSVNQAAHYAVRYFQDPGEGDPQSWIDTASRIDATHVVVHHAKEIYPFINYPMYDAPAMQDFCQSAHQRGLKVKPYYTVRELTSKLPEFFPLRTLGAEIFAQPKFNFDGVPGQGEKDAWLKQECGDDILPAWKATFTKGKYAGQTDPSVIINPASRIVNFYVEGLRWMCDNWQIDGIYVDDTGLDRHDLRRIRRVLDGRRPGAKIDLHSWNHFHDMWGEAWGHNAVMYAELFPYLDSLWLGEGFDFDELTPTQMLVECSGLPFGLMSEMLEGACNPWRGLLFGETARAGWRENGTEGVWQFRARYGFEDARMRGWWEEKPPVRSGDPRVLVTSYELPSGTMACAASFLEEEAEVSLMLDVEQLGFAPSAAHLPEIQGVQGGAQSQVNATYRIAPGKGVIVFFEK